MSQLPKKKTIRKVAADLPPNAVETSYDEYDYEEEPLGVAPSVSRTSNPEPVAQSPRTRATRDDVQNTGRGGRPTTYGDTRPQGSGGKRAGKGAGKDGSYQYQSRSAPPRRDVFPYVMGAVIGALFVGLLGLAYLLGTSGRLPGGTAAIEQNPIQPANGGSGGSGGSGSRPIQPTAAGGEPPRMPLNEFKALYDDPAKRPLIIDVRAKDAYDQGHIKGSISFPEADADTRVAELPKDKLVVAYCQ